MSEVILDYCSGVKTQPHTESYLAGGQCERCGYKAKEEKTDRPLRYPELDSTRHLRNSGRELLGRRLYATEKRDGSNVHFWLQPTSDDMAVQVRDRSGNGYRVWLSSRNMKMASGDILNNAKATKEYDHVIEMLKENPNWNVFCELIYGSSNGNPVYGPTRIEPRHKVGQLVLFDIAILSDKETFGKNNEPFSFLPYNYLHQQGYHFRVPVVKLYGEGRFADIDAYFAWVRDLLKYSRRHRREGVVIKSYDSPQIYVKEKVDLPERPKIVHQQDGAIILPTISDSEVYGALDKVFADFGLDFLRDKKKAMPKFVEYLSIECQKHTCSMPKRKLYEFYITYLATKSQ